MSSSGGGVVERASKEISRRIHSLGFSSKAAKQQQRSSSSSKEDPAEDKLNGNEVGEDDAKGASAAAASGVSRMGTIIKGSVMDKVTHVFNSSSMGNANNKDNKEQQSAAAAATAAAAGSVSPTGGGAGNNGINIPKGAVANGRAKFEAACGSLPQQQQQPLSEKPLRFFSSSRSRGNSPLLPVRTPKVPAAAANMQQPTNGKDSSLTPQVAKRKNFGGDVVVAATNPTTVAGKVTAVTAKPIDASKLFAKMRRFVPWEELWRDPKFLGRFFWFFSGMERHALARVCRCWRDVLYRPHYWRDQRPVLHCRDLRVAAAGVDGSVNGNDPGNSTKMDLFRSLETREFESLVLLHANDADVFDLVQKFPRAAKAVHGVTLRGCNLSDRGLEALMEFLQALYQLEIAGCNEVTEQGLWSSLHPRLVSITINDCINVADECICAVTQLLPSLYEFNLQAYHVTDSALSYFSPKQTGTLSVLRLQSCWEITNHGVVNIVHTLPNLTVLSLSGCSKVTDDGIELIAENLRKLRSLDVSWCPRVTDAALEYIACDLNHLEELTLDRCVHITDIGIGYISTMLALHTLFLRWCSQIRDFGLQHICGMRSMQVLSLAGCPLLTSSGLSNLIQLRHLVELELTNCPGATTELIDYLRQNLPNALVLD